MFRKFERHAMYHSKELSFALKMMLMILAVLFRLIVTACYFLQPG